MLWYCLLYITIYSTRYNTVIITILSQQFTPTVGVSSWSWWRRQRKRTNVENSDPDPHAHLDADAHSHPSAQPYRCAYAVRQSLCRSLSCSLLEAARGNPPWSPMSWSPNCCAQVESKLLSLMRIQTGFCLFWFKTGELNLGDNCWA